VPGPMSITNNSMVLDGDADAIEADGVRAISVRDNDITFANPAPNGSGVHLAAINGPIKPSHDHREHHHRTAVRNRRQHLTSPRSGSPPDHSPSATSPSR